MAENKNHAASSKFADAEKASVMAGGGVVPFRLPAGALSYLDRNQYNSNMEVVAYFPAVNLMIFGDEHSCMWAEGKRRLIAFQGGGDKGERPRHLSKLRLQQAIEKMDSGRFIPDAADAGNAAVSARQISR